MSEVDAAPHLARPRANFGDLTPMLAPNSVAVVGASERAGNLGGVAIGLLKQFGFNGPIWPVNPGRDTVSGLKCYPNLSDLPGVPDLVVLAVPGPAAIGLIEECGVLGIPAAVLWAGGFAEIGGAGKDLQKRLSEACRDANVQLCGPNCLGIVNASIGLMATFGSMYGDLDGLTPGTISMVSQSGGISGIASTLAQQMGLGFRVTVSCGNEVTLSLSDFLSAIIKDEGTTVVALYAEGISDPDNFIAALGEARRRGKTIVMLKTGASEESGRAALAHTGKLAGSDRMFEAIFREFAVIRVWSVEEMIDVCLLLATLGLDSLPKGRNIVTTTFGGGSGVLTADLCTQQNLHVKRLTPASTAKLGDLLTPLASPNNPIDLTPQSMNDPKWRELLPDALKCIADDDNVDMFLFLAGGMGHRRQEALEILCDLRAHTNKPIAVSWMAPPPGIRTDLADRGFFLFEEHARAVRALAHIANHAEALRKPIHQASAIPPSLDWSDYVDTTTTVAPEHVVTAILHAADLPVAQGYLATTPQEVRAAAERIGFPLAVKGISPKLTHRAAVGLLALNVESTDAVLRADAAFRSKAKALDASYDGTWIQRMLPSGFEIIVSALRDPDMGIMVGCGIGGNLTELIDDVAFARGPINVESAHNLLDQLKTLAHHPQALSKTQYRAAATFIAAFSQLAATAPWANFNLEVNPLKLGPQHAAAVDGLLVIERP